MRKYPKIRGWKWSRVRDMDVKQFLLHVYNETKQAGVTLQLTPTKTVACEGERINGFFDTEPPHTLAVATNHRMSLWLKVLVHEYSHFEQWRFNAPLWREGYVGGEDSSGLLFDWLGGKKFSRKKLLKIIKRTQACEWDCERRTLENIKRFSLPLDTGEYAQYANAYVYFYTWVGIRRKWYKAGSEPYRVPQILAAMPKTLSANYQEMSLDRIYLYDEYCR